MAGQESRAQIAQIAADQWGLITTSQAAAAGVSKMLLTRMTAAGELERITHGVYATPAASSDGLVETRAMWLALAPSRLAHERLADLPTAGVLSHASAAALHGIGDLLDDYVEITLPHRHRSRRPELRTHRAALERDDVTQVDGLPVTTVARTIADLVAAGNDREHVATALRDAIDRGLTTPRETRSALARRLGDNATATLSEFVVAAGLDPASLERAVARTDIGRHIAMTAVSATIAEILKNSDPYKELIEHQATPGIPDSVAAIWRDLIPEGDLLQLSEVAKDLGLRLDVSKVVGTAAHDGALAAMPSPTTAALSTALERWFVAPEASRAWSSARIASITSGADDEDGDEA